MMRQTQHTRTLHQENFRCLVERDPEGQVTAINLETVPDTGVSRAVRLNSTKAVRVAGAAHDILRTGGVSGRSWSSSKPLRLDYLTGAQLELLLVTVKPLRRADRIDYVAAGVAAMSLEEASYWHAKLYRPGGLPALRVLLGTGGTR